MGKKKKEEQTKDGEPPLQIGESYRGLPREVNDQLLREAVPTAEELRQHGTAFADTKREQVRAEHGLKSVSDENRKRDTAMYYQPMPGEDGAVKPVPTQGEKVDPSTEKGKAAPPAKAPSGTNKITPKPLDLQADSVQAPLEPETPMADRINAHKSVSRATTPKGEHKKISETALDSISQQQHSGAKKGVLKKEESKGASSDHGTSENKTGTGGSSSFRAIKERTARLKEARKQARINTGLTAKGRYDRVMHQRNEGRSFRKGMPILSETIEFTLERMKDHYKEQEDAGKMTKRALRERQKGIKKEKIDKNSLEKMFMTFLAVFKAIVFHHVFPNINNNLGMRMIFERILPCIEFPLHWLAVFCEPQLGYSMGQMCPYNPGYDESADAIDPIEGIPKGEPLVDTFPFAAPVFGVLFPYLCVFWVWRRAIPYVRLRILSNKHLVIGMLLCRSVLTVKRNPASVQVGMGVDGDDAMLTTFSLTSWLIIGLPLVYLIDTIIFLCFFPFREPPNFLAATKFFKAQLMMICGSPSFILFDVILITSEGPGGPREKTFAILGLLVSICTLWFTILRVSQVAYRNLITMWEVILLTSRMGKGTGGDSISAVSKAKQADIAAAAARIFPPFFIVMAQMKICSLEHEKYVINENELAQLGHCLFNNIYIKHLVIPSTCCKNLVKAGYTLFDAIEHCVIKMDNCVLESFNWFPITFCTSQTSFSRWTDTGTNADKEALHVAVNGIAMQRLLDIFHFLFKSDLGLRNSMTGEQCIGPNHHHKNQYTQHHRYGHEKLNLQYEMSFTDSCYYLAAGERMQQPWTDLEAIVFCRMMPYNKNLVHLDLSSNLLKDYGFMALAEFLFCNSQLKLLNISNNDLDGLQDRTLDTLLDAVVSHPRLESVQFSANTIQLPIRDFEDVEVLKWDAYNVYTINVNQIVGRVVELVLENQLSFDNFPPHCRFDHYCTIIQNALANDMALARQVSCSLHPKLRRFVAERCAKKLGHPLGNDPEDLLDLYVKDSRKVKQLTKKEKASRDDLYLPPKDRIVISVLGSLEGMAMAMTLRFSRHLREIFLEGNRVSDRGAEMFFRLLCEPGNVVEMLSLANNDIGYARNNYVKGRAVKWLQRVLQLPEANPMLQQIDLYQNDAFVAFEREIRVWVMARPQSDEIMPLECNVKRGMRG
ncbi:unnamed protein product [Amoebophrya sp. A120]|nr:unnamed protein product [Amoebophrya sp. A120]|eukprot:GSA120T00022555001.1